MYDNANDNMVMPVAPMNGYGSNSGFFGNDGWWIILLFLLWGNNGWSNGQGANFNALYPWMNNADQISDGFRDQMINNNISAIQTGVNGISQQLCNGFADITSNTNSAFYNMMSQFSNCCCENRLASADLKYAIATENCADRYEAANNTRDIIDNDNRNHQAMMDKLCQLELDGVRAQVTAKDDIISQLRSQIDALNTNAAVNNAVGRVLADNAAQTQILNPTPIPAFTVPAPYNCGCNNGCWS